MEWTKIGFKNGNESEARGVSVAGRATSAAPSRTLRGMATDYERVLSFFQAAADRYGVVIEGTVNRRPNGDAFDFFRARVPVVQLLDANIWFHSSGDRLDTISPVGLERTTRLFADVLERIDATGTAELRLRAR